MASPNPVTSTAPIATVPASCPTARSRASTGRWWRIVETSQWVNDDIDNCGTALISLTGYADRLRMFALLAYVNCKPTKPSCRSLRRAPGSTSKFPAPAAHGSARTAASRERSRLRMATRARSSPRGPTCPRSRSRAPRATGTSGGSGGEGQRETHVCDSFVGRSSRSSGRSAAPPTWRSSRPRSSWPASTRK